MVFRTIGDDLERRATVFSNKIKNYFKEYSSDNVIEYKVIQNHPILKYIFGYNPIDIGVGFLCENKKKSKFFKFLIKPKDIPLSYNDNDSIENLLENISLEINNPYLQNIKNEEVRYYVEKIRIIRDIVDSNTEGHWKSFSISKKPVSTNTLF